LVPPKPIRTLRNLTRYRKTQIQARQRETMRLHKAIEDTGIKLGCVATYIMGKSGRAMLDALVAGTTDPEILADARQGLVSRAAPLQPAPAVLRQDLAAERDRAPQSRRVIAAIVILVGIALLATPPRRPRAGGRSHGDA
jgi:hypothetical protein